MRPRIVLFGDSITQQSFRAGGWGASLAHAYSRKVDVVLRGYDGYNTRWALYMLPHLFPLESEITPPAAVTIFFGANDAALLEGTGKMQHVPLEEYWRNLRKIVQHIKSCSPETLVVLITPPPVDVERRKEYARSKYGVKASKMADRTNEVAGIYAELCAAVAREHCLPSINLWSKMQETKGWQKKFLSDGLHLTPEGNDVVFNEVFKILEEAGSQTCHLIFPHIQKLMKETLQPRFSYLLQSEFFWRTYTRSLAA